MLTVKFSSRIVVVVVVLQLISIYKIQIARRVDYYVHCTLDQQHVHIKK